MKRAATLIGLCLVAVGTIWYLRPCLIPGAPYTCEQYDRTKRFLACTAAADGLILAAVTRPDTLQAAQYRATCLPR